MAKKISSLTVDETLQRLDALSKDGNAKFHPTLGPEGQYEPKSENAKHLAHRLEKLGHGHRLKPARDPATEAAQDAIIRDRNIMHGAKQALLKSTHQNRRP